MKYAIRSVLVAVAILAMFTVANTSDRHDDHLEQIAAQKAFQDVLAKQDAANTAYAEAAHNAMMARNASGDYGEVYEYE